MAKNTNDWTLEAIAFYGDAGADVQAIIEYIDYRNHSRYSEGEIESVLKRLTKEQKVVQRQGSISRTVATHLEHYHNAR